jgi:hypothetical protein
MTQITDSLVRATTTFRVQCIACTRRISRSSLKAEISADEGPILSTFAGSPPEDAIQKNYPHTSLGRRLLST